MSLLKPKAFILLRNVLMVGKNKQIKTYDSCGMIIRTPGMISVTVKLKNRENQT